MQTKHLAHHARHFPKLAFAMSLACLSPLIAQEADVVISGSASATTVPKFWAGDSNFAPTLIVSSALTVSDPIATAADTTALVLGLAAPEDSAIAVDNEASFKLDLNHGLSGTGSDTGLTFPSAPIVSPTNPGGTAPNFTDYTGSGSELPAMVATNQVPEPSATASLLGGFGMLILLRRRRA